MKTFSLKVAFATGLLLATGGMALDDHAATAGVSPRDRSAAAEQSSPRAPRAPEERARGEARGRNAMGMMGGGMMGSTNGMGMMHGGGMMSGMGMMGGGSGMGGMGGARPNEQWRPGGPAR